MDNTDEILDIKSQPISVPIDTMYGEINDRPLISRKVHIPLIYAAAMILVTSFTLLGISSLNSILSEISSLFTNAIYEFVGLPPIVSTFVIGIFALGVGAVILVGANRARKGAEALVNNINLSLDEEPDEYYDLSIVNASYMIDEFIKRGCTGKLNDKGGFSIDCPEYPRTKKMEEVIHGFDEKYKYQQKIIQFIMINLSIIFIIFMFKWSSEAYEQYMVSESESLEFMGINVSIGQWIFLIILIFLLGLLIEFRTVPLWVVTVILLPTYMIIAKLLVPLFPIESFIIIMAFIICAIIITFVLMSFRPYLCVEKNSSVCDFI